MVKDNLPVSGYGVARYGSFNFHVLFSLYKKEVFRFLKVYMQTLLGPAITAILFLLIFTLSLGSVHREINNVPFGSFVASGLIMMSIMQNAFANTSSSLVGSRIMGNISDVITAPITSLEFLLGFSLAGITRGILVGLSTAIPFIFMVDMGLWSIFYTLLFVFLSSLMMAFLGLLTGIFVVKFDHLQAVTNFFVAPLTLLSGTFYSISRLPDFANFIAHYNPFFYAIDGLRYGITGHSEGSIIFGILFLSLLNLLLGIVTYICISRGYGLKQ